MKLSTWIFAIILLASPLCGDVVTLKDGTKIEGTVIRNSDGYWVKTADGETHTYPATDVASVTKASATAPPVAPPTPPNPVTPPAVPAPATPVTPFTSTLGPMKARAEQVDKPQAAVDLWEKFIKSMNPDDPNYSSAKAELARWRKLSTGGAEKINGAWIGGMDLFELRVRVFKLCIEAKAEIDSGETLAAVKALQQAMAIDPDSYNANAMMGFISMWKHDIDNAVKYFTAALKVHPDSPPVLADLGTVLVADKKQYEEGILDLYKAAQAHDSRGIAQNLAVAVYKTPVTMRSSPALKDAIDASKTLMGKYNIDPAALAAKGGWEMLLPTPIPPDEPTDSPVAGIEWSGTGFLIGADGLILTNRHVAADAAKLAVEIDGERRPAEVVVIDDEQDLALIRIKANTGEKFFPLSLSQNDSPANGAECTVLGYPMIDRLGATIKVTRGIVSSNTANGECDVLVDAKVNPGNSGGPMIDKNGQVAAIVAMKSVTEGFEDSYGMGISAGRIHKFLDKNKVKLPPPGANPAQPLGPEEIAKRATPATVCILSLK